MENSDDDVSTYAPAGIAPSMPTAISIWPRHAPDPGGHSDRSPGGCGGTRPMGAQGDGICRRPPAGVLAPSGDSNEGANRQARGTARRYRVAQDAAAGVVRAAFREGQRHGLDPMLILAVIAVESRFNPIAESEQGAVGLMQVVPRFHMDKIESLGAASMLLPEPNIAIGARILKDSIRRGGSDAAGLQLYNGAVDDETRTYANKVLNERRRLEDSLPRSHA